jgi:hypothetical protein
MHAARPGWVLSGAATTVGVGGVRAQNKKMTEGRNSSRRICILRLLVVRGAMPLQVAPALPLRPHWSPLALRVKLSRDERFLFEGVC